jgi:hypothetical protein
VYTGVTRRIIQRIKRNQDDDDEEHRRRKQRWTVLRGMGDPYTSPEIVLRVKILLVAVKIKATPPTILRCRENVFTELLPSNDKVIHRSTDTHVQQFFYCCVYSLPRERVYRAVA